jgi:hypothetical protein
MASMKYFLQMMKMMMKRAAFQKPLSTNQLLQVVLPVSEPPV